VPIQDMLKHFRAEVEAHIRLRLCPTGACPMKHRLAMTVL
jgi:NADP-reducing hydrogenase subunit HndC